MAVKTSRITVRIDPDSEARIAEAAALRQVSMSAFVTSAALAEADVVLARADTTLMPAEQFDALIEALDAPDPAPNLRRAARRRRRFTRT